MNTPIFALLQAGAYYNEPLVSAHAAQTGMYLLIILIAAARTWLKGRIPARMMLILWAAVMLRLPAAQSWQPGPRPSARFWQQFVITLPIL